MTYSPQPNLTHHRPPWLLLLIALGKLLKAAALIVVGFGVLHLVNPHAHEVFATWIHHLRVDQDNQLIHRVLERALAISPQKLKALSVGTFIYAAVYTIEGVGLLLDLTWAEWLTILTTSGYIPLELYQIWLKPRPLKVVLLLLNVAVVIYLIHRLWQKHQSRRAAPLPSPA